MDMVIIIIDIEQSSIMIDKKVDIYHHVIDIEAVLHLAIQLSQQIHQQHQQHHHL